MRRTGFSDDVWDLIIKLLDKDPNKRLGSMGTSDIKVHRWFRGVDWEAIERNDLAEFAKI